MMVQQHYLNSGVHQMRSSFESKPMNRVIQPIAPSSSSSSSSRLLFPSSSSSAVSNGNVPSAGNYSLFSTSTPTSSSSPSTSTSTPRSNLIQQSNSVNVKRYHHGGGLPSAPPPEMRGGIHPENMNMHRMQHQLSGSMDPLETVLGPFPCARVRGLPFDASLEDVLVFFQGLVVLDVVVMGNSYGQGSGEAFVVFANPMDFQMALQRDRQSMGPRFIEVFQGKRSDYYAAIAMQFKTQSHQNGFVGDGEDINPQETSNQGNVWAGSNATSSQVLRTTSVVNKGADLGLGSHNIGRGTNIASNKGSGGLVGNRTGRGMGDTRPRGGNAAAGRGSGRGGGIQVGDHTGYLRMRGLPFTATKKEIFDFFQSYDPMEDSITLTYRSDGRATGEGYIAFKSPDNAKDAMALHRNTMGSRYIELFISNKEEHSRSMARESTSR